MTTPTPDPADVELVDLIDRAWRNAPCPKCERVKACRCLLGDEELRKYRARAVVAALGSRLVSPDADTRTEWASEHSNHRVAGFPDPLVIEAGASRGLAETRVEAWGISHPHAAHRLLSRSTTTVFGPWVPVATPKGS